MYVNLFLYRGTRLRRAKKRLVISIILYIQTKFYVSFDVEPLMLMDHETTTTMLMSGTHQTQLWDGRKKEKRDSCLVLFIKFISMPLLCVICWWSLEFIVCEQAALYALAIEVVAIAISPPPLFLSFLTLYDDSSSHFHGDVYGNEQVSWRARFRVVRVYVRMFFSLAFSVFNIKQRGKNETTFPFLSHFSLGFLFLSICYNNDALQLIGILLFLFLL